MRPAARLILGLLLFSLAGCAGREPAAAPMAALALDGPPLALAGEYADMTLEGSMERSCMAGIGKLSLRAVNREEDFSCEAAFDSMPTAKGRIPGMLACSGERQLALYLRNLGPDQGVGIARENADSEMMILFYHPSAAEAARRLPAVKDDIAKARAMRQR